MKLNPAIKIAETLFPALCNAVVVDPDKIKFRITHGAASSSVSVTPEPEEAGNLIGKSGRTFKAFETLARIIGDRHQHPILFGVETDIGKNPAHKDRGQVDEKEWHPKTVDAMLCSTLSAFLHYTPEVRVLNDSRRRTTWEVLLDEEEPLCSVADSAVAAALDTIFSAIAKLYGKTVSIAYIRRGAGATPESNRQVDIQPASADGRYAKQLGTAA
jgi:predicted RNA-binding protein YlqC (UPF0109 family)